MNKVFLCTCHRPQRRGAYIAYKVLCVSNSHSSALGRCLVAYTETDMNDWKICEVSLFDDALFEICDESYCP